MKFCPTCQTKFDEEILRFCTKDGTPLVDENQPNFTALPSESIDTDEADLGEETIVSYKPSKNILPDEPAPLPDPEIDRSEAPRIVISTSEQERQQQNVRARQIPPYQPIPPPKQSTGKVVVLTILGTLAVLAVVLGLFAMLRDEEPASANFNVNTSQPDMNINNNLNFGAGNVNLSIPNSNYNYNTNYNTAFNTNFNINANTRTPTPSRTPTPTPTPDENNSNTNVNSAPPITPRPTVSATTTPNSTPRPTSPTPTRTPPPAGSPPGNSEQP